MMLKINTIFYIIFSYCILAIWPRAAL